MSAKQENSRTFITAKINETTREIATHVLQASQP
jgi:hypothetical protein